MYLFTHPHILPQYLTGDFGLKGRQECRRNVEGSDPESPRCDLNLHTES